MPRKSKSSVPPQNKLENVKLLRWECPPDAIWGGFINVSLSEGDKNDFFTWTLENAGAEQELLQSLLLAGMKYSASWDEENVCFVATFTGNLVEGANLRCCVSSRAASWADANALAIWKHFILLRENYGDLLVSGRKRNWG